MIRHIVLFCFKEEADGRKARVNAQMTKDMLDALPAKIPQIKKSETFLGADGQAVGNADLMLISDFDSEKDLREYLVHPDHVAVGTFMKPLRESRSCIDLKL